MALLFIVNVPYEPDEDDNYDDRAPKKLTEVEETAEEDDNIPEELSDVPINEPEKVEVDSNPAVISVTEITENDTDEVKLPENSIADITTDDIKPDTEKVEPITPETKPVEPKDPETTTNDTVSETENETTEDDQPKVSDDKPDCEVQSDINQSEKPTEKPSVRFETTLNDKHLEDEPLIPLISKIPLHKEIEHELEKLDVKGVDIHFVDNGKILKFSFIEEDSQRSEAILNRLRKICAGKSGANISVFPANLHEKFGEDLDSVSNVKDDVTQKKKPSEEAVQKESLFRKSVKSRLLVAQVVKSVTDNACFTFDYLLLLILASLISCIGLVENSSVVLVASMLISPLMGPILAATFGHVIHNYDLRNLGLKSEMKGLAICLIIGFTFGLISGGVGLYGAVWGSTDSWPTSEMRSRGMLRSLWVGMLIALPSGAGVAISVLGGNAGSLVGVAISASLLPPACNAGMLWAYGLLAAFKVPATVQGPTSTSIMATTASTLLNKTLTTVPFLNTTTPYNTTLSPSTTPQTTTVPADLSDCLPLHNNAYEPVYFCNVAHEAAILGLVSLSLTLLNICCIMVMGVLVLKIKEVSPQTAASDVDKFWKEDVQVARSYYATARGQASKSLGKMFLDEYKKIQADKNKSRETDVDESSDMTFEVATLELRNILQNAENSPDCQKIMSKLQNRPMRGVAEELDNEYNEAALMLSDKLEKKQRRLEEKQNPHHTFHHVPQTSRPGVAEIQAAFKSRKALSMMIDPVLFDQFKQFGVPEASVSTTNEVTSDDELHKTHKSRKLPSFNLSNPKHSKLVKRRLPKVKFEVTKVDEEEEENFVN